MGVLALGASDCEALHSGWLGQPVSCLSSLAYVAAGAYVLRRGGPPATAAALGAVGLGSVLYHGPMPAGAEALHDGSIAALAATMAITAAGAARSAAATAGAATAATQGSAVRRRSLARPPAAALVAFGAAIAINLLTRTGGPLCRPHPVAQGHAAWHVLTALALALWLARWRRLDNG